MFFDDLGTSLQSPQGKAWVDCRDRALSGYTFVPVPMPARLPG